MKLKARALLVMTVAAATLWLGGCGHYVCDHTFGNATCSSSSSGFGSGSGSSPSETALVYTMDDKVGQMAAEGLNIDNSGIFNPLGAFVSPTFNEPANEPDGGMVIVDKQFLYIVFNDGDLFGYTIDATNGALTAIGTGPYSVTEGGYSIKADPNGAVLFVGGGAGISTFTISQTDGSLTLVGSYSTSGIIPTDITTDGLGKYVYAVTGSTVAAFSYTSSGVLTAVAGSPFSAGMGQIHGEASGQYILGITQEIGVSGTAPDEHVYVFPITQSGTSAGALGTAVKWPTVYAPIHIVVSPDGGFVYTFNELWVNSLETTIEPVEGFSFSSSTGVVTELSSYSPFTTLLGTAGKFDQSGQYLFMLGTTTNSPAAGMVPLNASTSSGSLTSTLSSAGTLGTTFAVTNVP